MKKILFVLMAALFVASTSFAQTRAMLGDPASENSSASARKENVKKTKARKAKKTASKTARKSGKSVKKSAQKAKRPKRAKAVKRPGSDDGLEGSLR